MTLGGRAARMLAHQAIDSAGEEGESGSRTSPAGYLADARPEELGFW